ncbi:hypothetical protein J0895_12570 [Phormidium pseudopriestleyi FRX01]|uniref:Uncharacterized protein n=1 Tax=Phormidium pseudopriestleyi FRX01 TaxID=1759528 RepID=A0ABS3FUA8_9CYAN|nr:hypothetical protein [Phormidium pseudopriestleyi]MBO0349932.1 hypothetical protein [Phormidium pseudopriestleyi FRX01]
MRVVKSGRMLGLSLESSNRRLGDVRPFCGQLLETQNQPNRSQHSYLILTIRLQAGSKVAIFSKHRTPELAKKANPASRLSTPRMTPHPNSKTIRRLLYDAPDRRNRAIPDSDGELYCSLGQLLHDEKRRSKTGDFARSPQTVQVRQSVALKWRMEPRVDHPCFLLGSLDEGIEVFKGKNCPELTTINSREFPFELTEI